MSDDYDDEDLEREEDGDDDGLEVLQFRVLMQDGTRYEVEVINPDMTRFDRDRDRLKLGTARDAPIIWQTYVVWAALSRTRQLERGMPFTVFDRAVRRISKIGERTVDPTRSAPEPG